MFDSLDMAEVRYNRSFPLYSPTEAFDLIETDPRTIDVDLEKVSLGWDPKSLLCLWREMESKFQIHRSRRAAFHFLVTAPTDWHEEDAKISTHDDAVRFLQLENRRWRSKWEKGGLFERLGCVDPDTPESLRNASMPVIGFWLFPVDAFGEVPEGNFREIRWNMKEVRNLTKHRPQLGVFRLPCKG